MPGAGPLVIMPAGGTVPKWGHRHDGITSGSPTSRNFRTRPFYPQPNWWTTNSPIHV